MDLTSDITKNVFQAAFEEAERRDKSMTQQELEMIAIMEAVGTKKGLDFSYEDIAKALIEEGYVKARDNQDKD